MSDDERDARLLKPDALFSSCGRWRFILTRNWDLTRPVLVFIMLNPSVASAERDDPTVKRCIEFARAWGYGGIVVVNLFALVSSDPKALPAYYGEHRLPEAPSDADELRHVVGQCNGRRVVAAWGAHKVIAKTGRDKLVLDALAGRRIYCIGPRDKFPPHPLYRRGDLRLEVYREGDVDEPDPAPLMTTGSLFG